MVTVFRREECVRREFVGTVIIQSRDFESENIPTRLTAYTPTLPI